MIQVPGKAWDSKFRVYGLEGAFAPFLFAYKKNGQAAEAYLPKSSLHCGVYVTRTRDPLRDRQVF